MLEALADGRTDMPDLYRAAFAPNRCPIHDRMPVVLEPGSWPLWLGDLEGDAKALLHPAGDVLPCWPISRRVNSPANNDVDLLSKAE